MIHLCHLPHIVFHCLSLSPFSPEQSHFPGTFNSRLLPYMAGTRPSLSDTTDPLTDGPLIIDNIYRVCYSVNIKILTMDIVNKRGSYVHEDA